MGETANKPVMSVGPLECLSNSGKGFFCCLSLELSYLDHTDVLCLVFLFFLRFFFLDVDHLKSLY